ncbi:MAG: transcriptional regulator GcvA [Burkholderiales bacterium]|nr:transcriptional regulator GcvA [Burkholderiales bacterium]
MTDFRRLPNLAALRAFEAAARHQNFSHAAEEIHVTHGAISHQVRALEEDLGLALFVRNGKKLTITSEGSAFADVIRQALTEIAQAADGLRQQQNHMRLGVTALPSFAARWLSPRIGQFIEQYPNLEVSLQSSNALANFQRDGVDIGIRFGAGQYPGLITEHLLDDYYYPVASPHYNGGHLPTTIHELEHAHLLRCSGEPWVPWFRLAGSNFPEPTSGLVFQDSAMLAHAAVDGQGIALGRHSIVQSDIASGALIRLFDINLAASSSYYLVYPPHALAKPQVAAFRHWLLQQIAQ